MIVVYTNCADESVKNFEHAYLNGVFGIDRSIRIPYVTIENPLVAILQAQASNRV